MCQRILVEDPDAIDIVSKKTEHGCDFFAIRPMVMERPFVDSHGCVCSSLEDWLQAERGYAEHM